MNLYNFKNFKHNLNINNYEIKQQQDNEHIIIKVLVNNNVYPSLCFNFIKEDKIFIYKTPWINSRFNMVWIDSTGDIVTYNNIIIQAMAFILNNNIVKIISSEKHKVHNFIRYELSLTDLALLEAI